MVVDLKTAVAVCCGGIFAALLLSALSCTTRKHMASSESRYNQRDERRIDRHDSLLYQAYRSSHRQHTQAGVSLLEIEPIGTFRFHPDSGFRGEARVVRVYNHTRQQTVTTDSTQQSRHEGTSHHEVLTSHTSTHTKTKEKHVQREPFQVPWGWAVLAVGLILFIRYKLR